MSTAIEVLPTTIQTAGKNPIAISFTSRISESTTPAFMGALVNAANNGHDEIHLLLSTPGGSVTDGITLYNLIQALPMPVHIYNMGTVDSIGNVIYLAGQRKIAATNSSFMFHGVGLDIAQSTRLELKNLRESIATVENSQSLMANIISRHTNLDIGKVNEMFLEMVHITAQEALKRGISDEVCDIRLPKGLPIQQLIF